MVLYTTNSSTFIIISAVEITQPQQWVNDLWRMYYYWAEKHGYKVDVLEVSTDDHAPGAHGKLNYLTIEVISCPVDYP